MIPQKKAIKEQTQIKVELELLKHLRIGKLSLGIAQQRMRQCWVGTTESRSSKATKGCNVYPVKE